MFDDAMEYEDILIALEGMTEGDEFAASLVAQYRRKGELSERQWDAAERMIRKVQDTKQRKASLQRSVDVSAIAALLNGAKVKRPVFRAAGLSFSMAPARGKNAGAVYVKADGEYQGKIMDGQFMAASACMPSTADAVVSVANDPRGEAIRYGKTTGRCACCGRELSDAVSVELGVGPICLEKWGL